MNNLKTIREIYEPYKNTCDKGNGHSYLDFYGKIFEPFRHKKNLKFMEIGIQSGGSIKLWTQYFTNIEKIIGIDIDQTSLKYIELLNLPNVNLIFKNINDPFFDNYNEMFDIIIDDASHLLEDQKRCIKIFNSKINKNGFLIIEDIQKIEYINELKQLLNFQVIDFRPISHRCDDILLVFQNI